MTTNDIKKNLEDLRDSIRANIEKNKLQLFDLKIEAKKLEKMLKQTEKQIENLSSND